MTTTRATTTRAAGTTGPALTTQAAPAAGAAQPPATGADRAAPETPAPPAPLSLYGFLRPRPERADEVRRLLASLVESTRAEEGNLEYHLHEHDDGRLFLYEVWRSQEDLDRHNAHPPLRAFLDNIADYLAEAPEAYAGTMVSRYPAAD
ncbi:putative quinol monooxygenase [Streptomyces sp. NPDC018031]|uniref:putative quinol monooxygenase n=1 Tax=Streptomyces sp. NPDC018031 TaxID=3365033 RepID=UPI00379163C0